jgi:hypothetical protein
MDACAKKAMKEFWQWTLVPTCPPAEKLYKKKKKKKKRWSLRDLFGMS